MATPLSASRQLAALRAEGCKVVEYKSWRSHNRNHRGSWGPVHGVMIHHTVTSGTASSVALCYNGYSGLPGPLCHTVGAKDGTLYMVGNGRANHAGLGDDDVLRAVIAEGPVPTDNEANTDGNARFYGIELINLGNGRDPWPEAQLDAATRWAAALCRAHGWSERSVIGHLEWQPGKIDPRGFTMNSFRARVRALLAQPAGATGPTEDDMPETLGHYDTRDTDVAPNQWVTLPIERTDLFDDARAYTATAHVVLEVPATDPDGNPAIGTVQGRFVHIGDDHEWRSEIVERVTTGGSTFADFSNSGSISAGEKVRFEFVYYPAPNLSDEDAARPARITTRRLRGLYWE